jgi:Putative redox-active protein (C_GCAxxG_C_C)
MWETSGWKHEDLLWASMGLFGGIAGQQSATCGAVSSAAVYLGLRHRRPIADQTAVRQARAEIEREAGSLAGQFRSRFGTLVCRDLVGVDLSDPQIRRRFQEHNLSKDTCDLFVAFVIARLYDLEKARLSA